MNNSEDDNINLRYDKGFIYEILLLKYKSYFSRLISVNTTFRIIISAILFVLTSFPYYRNEYIPLGLLSVIFWLLFFMILTWVTQRISLQLDIDRLEKKIFRREENKSQVSDFYIWFFYIPLKAKRIRNLLSLSVVIEPIFWFLIAFFIFNLNTNYLQSNNYRNQDLVGFDFSNQELQKFNFTNSSLAKADLTGADLSRAILRKVDLTEADLTEADLSFANLGGANLQKAYLRDANLQKAYLRDANLQKAYLRDANLQKAYLRGVNLQETDLFNVNLQKAYLNLASLQGANLRLANLQNTNLMLASLKNAILWEANLQEAYLVGANLREANLRDTNLQKANLRKANLQDAFLFGANLQGAILVDTENLTLKQIKFTCFWDRAIYKGQWNEKKQTFVAIEFVNANFIKELKNDTASDPDKPIDCSRWEKEN